MQGPAPVTYDILHLPEIITDINSRTKLISDFRNLVEKRTSIEKDYSEKLMSLAASAPDSPALHSQSATQKLYNSLVSTLRNEAENVANYAKKMRKEILNQLESKIPSINQQTKKLIMVAKSLAKDLDNQQESFLKAKEKYMKKCTDLKKKVEEYLIGMLGELSFDKKNETLIKASWDCEKDYHELTNLYNKQHYKYNQFAETQALKLKQTIRKLTTYQLKKVELIKTSYMNLQLERSNYGTTMVKDNNSLITQIHLLSQEYLDLTFPQDQNDLTNTLLEKRLDPCGYVIKLFSSMKSQKTESLIFYGQSKEHKNALEASLSGVFEEEQESASKIFEISSLFQSAFDENSSFSQEKSQRLQELMIYNPESRKDFILCLQKFRRNNQFQMKEQSLPKIQGVLNSFLTICYNQKDTYNSKLLMVLSFTYYIKQEGREIYLAENILDHKIWKDQEWWECAIFQSIYEEVQVKNKNYEEIVINIWDIKGSGVRQNESDYESPFQAIIFNQLIYYIHNIKLFKLPEEMMNEIARKYSRLFSLSRKMKTQLYKAMRPSTMSVEEDMKSDSSGSGSKKYD